MTILTKENVAAGGTRFEAACAAGECVPGLILGLVSPVRVRFRQAEEPGGNDASSPKV